MSGKVKTLGELASFLGARLVGDSDATVVGLAAIQSATPGTLSFIANPKYQSWLDDTQATAVILSESLLARCPCNALVIDNPYLAYAKVSHLFATEALNPPGIHPSAVIAADAQVAASAHIGPLVVIESGAQIGVGAVIGAQCYIGANTQIGAQTRLWPNVTIYHGVKIGQRTIIHAGTVIGSDGFGYAVAATAKGLPDVAGQCQLKWQKIAQIGGVVIGDDVEVGACTTIDRGAIGNTIIESGVIMDNQVHIAHNASVGENTAIAGKSGVSGSSRLGRNCTMAGMSGLVGHIEVCDNVHISAMTAISRSITRPGVYTSGTGMEEHAGWLKNAARFRHLDAMARKLAELERRLGRLDGTE
ncbi:MAG: UDP-3-O-(3-hydroxymyristoyl)glucosamine N-acyltransferase [Pseudomonadota bacterium]